MSVHFPSEFNAYWRMPGTKAAFVSEVATTNPKDCKNCGGIGTMTTFCALAGPFDAIPAGVAHFANGKWWAGAHYSANCPDCHGTGLDPKHVESPIRKGVIPWDSIGNQRGGPREEDPQPLDEIECTL
jgi:DnaJ-class molecular chaperone